MKLKDFILLVFKFLCMIVTVLMIGYLIAKFLAIHEDVIVIDYKSVATDTEVDFFHPELSICFRYPVNRNDHFNRTNGTSSLRYIQFEPNLADYINDTHLRIYSTYYNKYSKITCTDLENCTHFHFKNQDNEMIDRVISKCFTFGVHIKVSSLFIQFNANWTNVLDKFSQVFVSFNQPKAFSSPPYGRLYFNTWTKKLGKNEKIMSDIFQIQYINFTRRRGNPKSPCHVSFPDTLIQKNVPGQSNFSNNYSIKGFVENKKHPFDYMKETFWEPLTSPEAFSEFLTDYPCHEMFKIDYRHSRWFQSERNLFQPIQNESLDRDTQQYTLTVYYPLFIKVMKEEKKFDELDLFGAIGGYIGLFWGIL